MSDHPLVPSEQKEVRFYDDEITVVLVQRETRQEIFVSIRQMCDLLGVSYQGQIRRINDDPVLAKHVQGVNVTFTPSGGRGGGPQTTNCLNLEYLNGWLFGINANRVKAEVRERLILYQEKCFQVLAEAFREERLTTEVDLEDLLQNSESDAVQAYRLLQALVKLARNQVLMEAQLETHNLRLDRHELRFESQDERLEQIETLLGDPGHHVSPDQAMQISQAVKTIAIELGKKTKRNEFGGVYGELYRKFGITSYKALPAGKFESAIAWLNEWYQGLTGETPF